MRGIAVLSAVFVLSLAGITGCSGKSDESPAFEEPALEPRENSRSAEVGDPFFGDLDEIFEKGFLRVLVAPSRTNFFFDQGELRGFDVEMMRAFRDDLNRGRKTADKVKLIFVPRPFGDLLPSLEEGIGDLAIGGMTVMPSRVGATIFSKSYLTGVEEVVVHNSSVIDLNTLEDLGGRTVTVRRESSYEVHLAQVGEDFENRGLEAPSVRALGSSLATEDVLEMVNAGIIDVTVADRHLAEVWATLMPDLVVRSDLVIRGGGALAVAVRPSDPRLLEALNGFIGKNKKGSLLGNVLFTRYFEKTSWLKNPGTEFEDLLSTSMIGLFRDYAARYDFNWINIAAQAYRESRFDQTKRSRAGAIGIMQVRPATAADPNVGIDGIEDIENNIHAGVKYLAFVRDRYFSDAEISAKNRLDFALAAYNAGPRRVVNARKGASDRGLDPNVWFNHVELIVAQEVGREPVDYVRDIHAYSFALRLAYDERIRRDLDRESLKR